MLCGNLSSHWICHQQCCKRRLRKGFIINLYNVSRWARVKMYFFSLHLSFQFICTKSYLVYKLIYNAHNLDYAFSQCFIITVLTAKLMNWTHCITLPINTDEMQNVLLEMSLFQSLKSTYSSHKPPPFHVSLKNKNCITKLVLVYLEIFYCCTILHFLRIHMDWSC